MLYVFFADGQDSLKCDVYQYSEVNDTALGLIQYFNTDNKITHEVFIGFRYSKDSYSPDQNVYYTYLDGHMKSKQTIYSNGDSVIEMYHYNSDQLMIQHTRQSFKSHPYSQDSTSNVITTTYKYIDSTMVSAYSVDTQGDTISIQTYDYEDSTIVMKIEIYDYPVNHPYRHLIIYRTLNKNGDLAQERAGFGNESFYGYKELFYDKNKRLIKVIEKDESMRDVMTSIYKYSY